MKTIKLDAEKLLAAAHCINYKYLRDLHEIHNTIAIDVDSGTMIACHGHAGLRIEGAVIESSEGVTGCYSVALSENTLKNWKALCAKKEPVELRLDSNEITGSNFIIKVDLRSGTDNLSTYKRITDEQQTPTEPRAYTLSMENMKRALDVCKAIGAKYMKYEAVTGKGIPDNVVVTFVGKNAQMLVMGAIG
ncbi:MAG: hypothetical protein ACPGXY_03195 [Alphaproteobacteria bacterium]